MIISIFSPQDPYEGGLTIIATLQRKEGPYGSQ